MRDKILFIGSFSLPKNGYYGGVYIACTSLKDGLVKKGYQIIELDTTLKDISETRVHRRFPNIIIRQFKFLYNIFFSSDAKFLFIFLSGGFSYIDKFLPILFAKILGKKVVIFPRSGHLIDDYKKFYLSIFIDKLLALSDYIICQSFFWKKYFSSKVSNKNKLIIIENWKNYKDIEEANVLNYPTYTLENKELFKIILVTRIEKAKGVDDIILLARRLKNKLNFCIHVYGVGSYQDDFIDSIESYDVSKNVIFKGWLEKRILLKTINSYHLAIFTSHTEGFPNGLLDYIFAKTPILSTRIPMVVAVGGNKMNYYTPGNIIEMEEKIISICKNYNLYVQKSKDLYIQKLSKNSIGSSIRKLERILK